MALTQEQFLQIVDTQSPNSVNIWYSDTEPLTVFGMTVPVVDNTGTNSIQLLQSAQQLNISLNSQNYTFQVNASYERTSQGYTYYFFDVVDQVISSLADDVPSIPGEILYIIPGFQSTNFFGGDYDALIHNVEASRLSSFIMTSDRHKVTGGAGSQNPINIDALRTLTAKKANVQDSNYASTGWVNSRYEGTVTDSTTYGGIDSAITGRSFQASFFPSSVSSETINRQISSSQVLYSEYLSTSKEDIPTTASLSSVKYQTVNATVPPTETQIQIQLTVNPVAADIEIGDIILLNYPSSPLEYIRVENIQPFGNNLMLTVTRGWNNTVKQSYASPNLPIQKIVGPTKVYQLQGNKVQGVEKGQLVVKDSQEILTIDILGQVINLS